MIHLAPLRYLLLVALHGYQALNPGPCLDRDADGVCDARDLCWGDDAAGDADGDRLCDDRDHCFGENRTGDVDGDRLCGDRDRCLGVNATGDADADAVCDDRDACLGDDATGDADADGTCADRDPCFGDDATGDADADAVCDDRDVCLGDDALGDGDWDGRCDDASDLCVGFDPMGDADGDGVCDCLGLVGTGDRDADGVCDDVDPCDDHAPGAPLAGCQLPQPLPVNTCAGTPLYNDEGRNTGVVVCPDGSTDRLFASSGWYAAETTPDTQVPPPQAGQCAKDDECRTGLEGACLTEYYLWIAVANVCVYGCDSDADCGAGQACLPPGVLRGEVPGDAIRGRGVCIAATCRTNADCASGECGVAETDNGCVGQYFDTLRMDCRTPSDACRVHQDCWTWGWGGQVTDQRCRSTPTGFQCHTPPSTCGRPLRDDAGAWVTAPVTTGAGWAADIALRPLSPEDRDTLRAHWERIAQLEHASVASFARHALELLTLGAPADLLADVLAAQVDELRHARLAFGVAAAVAGAERAPGPLVTPPPRTTPAAILAAVLDEGCVGETVAAAEAALCAARATDPALAAILRQIAEDEARHAALAWRTAAWMIGAYPELAHLVDDLAEAPRRSPAPPRGPAADLGVLTAAELAHLTDTVRAEVIAPVAASLRPWARAA